MVQAIFQKTQVSPSTLDNPMPRYLLECNPVEEVTTQGALTPQLHPPEKTASSKYNSTIGLSPLNNLRGKWSSILQHKTRPDSPVPTLQGP